MLELYFNDETDTVDGDLQEMISKLLVFAAKQEGILDKAEISITFMTDSEIQKINAEYRGINEPTDVISFALEEVMDTEVPIVAVEGLPRMLGDIIISVETAKKQAADYGHDFHREMGFLSLHGFLHLLGYDHLTEDDETKMFARQKEILDSFGLER